ncbi:MAG: DUF1003 domain-containing protein [Dermatophilus congolensis]|nr:DUF1003 domain-containing protein [Dermatophilus congolensis]
MAEPSRGDRLDQPREGRRRWINRPAMLREGAFGVASEQFARFMGTPVFLVWMTIFVVVWLAWNTFMPESAQFDPRSLNYTLLTLILSLQASYAAPLLLLAQNRQDDRDRVIAEQDRARDERNLSDTEYLTREVAALRFAMRDMVTRDYLRSELRDLLEEMRDELREPGAEPDEEPAAPPQRRRKKPKSHSGHSSKSDKSHPATGAIPVVPPAGEPTGTGPGETASEAPASDG